MKTQCPACEKRLLIKDDRIRKQVQCPACRAQFFANKIDDIPSNSAMDVRAERAPEEVVEPIRFYCSGCNRKLKVPSRLAGKKSKCPGCGCAIEIPRESEPDPMELASADAPANPDQFAPPVVFRPHTRMGFPSVCVGCLKADPDKEFLICCRPYVEVIREATALERTKNLAGKITGGILGGIFGGGEFGALLGAGMGGAVAGEGGKTIVREPYKVPVCSACLADISKDDAQQLAADVDLDNPPPLRFNRFLSREFKKQHVIIRFAELRYREKFLAHNPRGTFESIEASLKKEAAANSPYAKLLFKPPGTRAEFLARLIDKLLPADSAAGWYRLPDIPEKKIANALAKYAKDVKGEEAIGLSDETVFGSAKEGFVIASGGIWYNRGGYFGQFLWDDIRSVETSKGMLGTWVTVKLEGSRTASIACEKFKPKVQSLVQFITQMGLLCEIERNNVMPGQEAGPNENASESTTLGTQGNCPKCGFSYAWDGSACQHCHHRT